MAESGSGGVDRCMPLEIACDESGWEGSNLATGNSDVIAYASVQLDTDVAAACIRELRARSGQHGLEYKASNLLRANGGSLLAAFLGPSGTVRGHAWVHLTHKSCFLLGRVLDMFLGDCVDAASLGLRPDARLASDAAWLCHAGPDTFGPQAWRALLATASVVVSGRRRHEGRAPVDAFLGQVEVLRALDGGGRIAGILDELRDRRPEAYSARARMQADRALQPIGEALLPALASTVLHWSRGLDPIAVVHDEQSALNERRVRRLEQVLAAPPLELIRMPATGRLVRYRQADSRTDPRVQVADLLAGVARKIAAEQLLGRGDPDLTGLLRPYLDPASRWCEPRLFGLAER